MESNTFYSIVLSSKAQSELSAAWLWYEEREQGLGDRLVAAVMQKLKLIVKNPEASTAKHQSYRETQVSVFPFLIIYKIKKRKKTIEVVSIFHSSRNPSKKY